MNRIRSWLSKKYLKRIFLTVSLLIVLLVSISSAALYVNSERTVMNVHHKANEKVLTQINYNIHYMNEIAKNSATSLFFDTEMEYLRYARELDMQMYISSIHRLDTVASSSSIISSVFIYNRYHDDFFIANANVRQTTTPYFINQLKAFIHSKDLPRMQLIPFTDDGSQLDGSGKFDRFVYLMEEYDKDGKINNMMILMISPQWIFENIRLLNQTDSSDQGNFIIIDGKKQLLFANQQENKVGESQMAMINREISEYDVPKGSFTIGKGNKREVVSFWETDVTNWIILNIEPYDSVMQDVLKLRNTSIFIIIIVLIIAVSLTVIATNNLYKPVDNFMRQLRGGDNDEDEVENKLSANQDEFTYVTNTYKQMSEKLKLVRKDSEEKQTLVKSYYFRKLLLNSSTITAQELEQFTENNDILFEVSEYHAVCIIHIDHFHEFDSNTDESDKRLYYFAISNITDELISSEYISETMDMRRDHMASIISIPKNEINSFMEKITPALKRIQQVTERYYKLSLTVSISEPFEEIRDITDHYSQALQYSLYRMKYGHQSIITPDMAAEKSDISDFYISSDLERKLVEGLKSSETETIMQFLDQYMELASELSYDQMMQAFYQVISVTRKTLKEMNVFKLQPISVDMNKVHREILQKETIGEVKEVLEQFYKELTGEMKSIPSLNKNVVLLETIKEIVQLNYTDVNLSLQSVASMLQMSASYVGRSFKKSEGRSVAEYINDVRLSQAEKLLSNQDFSVIEIMERVGFINQSQFFKLFKKKFGATPREYRLKKLID